MANFITYEGLKLPFYPWESVVQHHDDFIRQPGPTMVRRIKIGSYVRELLRRPDGLRQTLQVAEETLSGFAAACAAEVIPHTWGITRPPNLGQETHTGPFRLAAEVPIVATSDHSDLTNHKSTLQLLGYFRDYRLENWQYSYSDAKLEQFVVGTLPTAATDIAPQRWLVDIDLLISSLAPDNSIESQ